MNVETGKLKPGQARHPAETTQEIIARDKNEAPGWVRSESYEWLGDDAWLRPALTPRPASRSPTAS